MQYEIIILELLTRIKKLEEEVERLKRNQIDFLEGSSQSNTNVVANTDYQNQNHSSVSYQKMTDEMIDICYKCGKKVSAGENVQELADDIAEETGMNRNSAIMYLYAVQGMLDGTIYKRAISAKAMKTYFNNISNEFGSKGLRKAIHATRLHINYRRDCGQKVDLIEEICDSYERRL